MNKKLVRVVEDVRESDAHISVSNIIDMDGNWIFLCFTRRFLKLSSIPLKLFLFLSFLLIVIVSFGHTPLMASTPLSQATSGQLEKIKWRRSLRSEGFGVSRRQRRSGISFGCLVRVDYYRLCVMFSSWWSSRISHSSSSGLWCS